MPTMNELTRANVERQKEWYQKSQITLSYRGNEIAGEVGEACNIIKKLERERLGIVGSRSTRENLAAELADVIICVSLIAGAEDLDLDHWVTDTFNRKSEEMGFRTRLTSHSPAVCGSQVEQPAAHAQDEKAQPVVGPNTQMTDFDDKSIDEAIDRQNAEYDALSDLKDQYLDGICKVAVVDDDFPRVKHRYETSLMSFIEALKNNGRLPTLLQLETTKKMYAELKIRFDKLGGKP